VALGFVAAYSMCLFIPPIRDEVTSFRRLLGELRLFGGTAKPTA
jgi:hypothetical protein